MGNPSKYARPKLVEMFMLPTDSGLPSAQLLEDAFFCVSKVLASHDRKTPEHLWSTLTAIHELAQKEKTIQHELKLNCWWTIVAAALAWHQEKEKLSLKVEDILKHWSPKSTVCVPLFGRVLGHKRTTRELPLDRCDWFNKLVKRQVQVEELQKQAVQRVKDNLHMDSEERKKRLESLEAEAERENDKQENILSVT